MFDAELAEPKFKLGGRRYVLTENYYGRTLVGGRNFDNGYVKYNGLTGEITARIGYSWDGCSIPRWVTKVAGLLHDISYQLGREGVFAKVVRAREVIDAYFFHNLKAKKVSDWKARAMYTAVRGFGASSFRK
jgi:hypothetical protein